MNKNFFSGNRKKLVNQKARLIILAGYDAMQWQGDEAIPFRQEANFYYLTGINEPGWRLVVDGEAAKSYLISPDISPAQELFDGRINIKAAMEISGVDEVLAAKGATALFEELSDKYSEVLTLGDPYYAKYANFSFNPAEATLRKDLQKKFEKVIDIRPEIEKLRTIKQPLEIAQLKESARIAVEAFSTVHGNIRDFNYEYELESELGYYYRKNNYKHAFQPIVASGPDACTLHYASNNKKLKGSGLVLIDSGASFGGYSSDITRTYAYSKPTKRQKAVHQAVQKALREIIELIKPGVKLKEYLKASDGIMKQALLTLGLMRDFKDEAGYRRYFPHAISHGLGLEIHENLTGYEEFHSGMVLTVEPGIYIPEESIGVRIEDDILVTRAGTLNLTKDLSTEL